MKFYYYIQSNDGREEILRLFSPYIIEEFAKSLMQVYISNNVKVKNLPNGEYKVTLYRTIENKEEGVNQYDIFTKLDTDLVWHNSRKV